MSRCVVIGFDGLSKGEFTADVNRSWALICPSVAGGGKSTIVLPKGVESKDWMKIGQIIFVEQEGLPPWVGMIDTPWNAVLPVQISVYNIEYLLSLRCLDNVLIVEGTVFSVLQQLVNLANSQQDIFIRAKDFMSGTQSTLREVLDQRDIWTHIKAIALRYGVEIFFSARHRGINPNLTIDMNITRRAGVTTGYELRDGPDGNMRVNTISLEGAIRNRLVGIGQQSTMGERLNLSPIYDVPSIEAYRMRGGVFQTQADNDPQLLSKTGTELARVAQPYLKMSLEVKNQGDAAQYIRLGNSLVVHAANVVLPGGKQGWRGPARIKVIAYNEDSNCFSLALEAKL